MGVFDHIRVLREVTDLDVRYALVSPSTLQALFAHLRGLGVGPGDELGMVRLVRAYILQSEDDAWTTSVRWASFSLSQPRGTSLALMDGPEVLATLRIAVPYVRLEAIVSAARGALDGMLSSSGPTSLVLTAGASPDDPRGRQQTPSVSSLSTPRVIALRTPRVRSGRES